VPTFSIAYRRFIEINDQLNTEDGQTGKIILHNLYTTRDSTMPAKAPSQPGQSHQNSMSGDKSSACGKTPDKQEISGDGSNRILTERRLSRNHLVRHSQD
jgi:hypothetical protein